MTCSTSVQSCTKLFPIFEGSSWSTSILSSGIAQSSSLSNTIIYQSFHQGRCEATVAWVSKYGWGGLICPWLVSNFRHFNNHRWIIGVSFDSFGLGSSKQISCKGSTPHDSLSLGRDLSPYYRATLEGGNILWFWLNLFWFYGVNQRRWLPAWSSG